MHSSVKPPHTPSLRKQRNKRVYSEYESQRRLCCRCCKHVKTHISYIIVVYNLQSPPRLPEEKKERERDDIMIIIHGRCIGCCFTTRNNKTLRSRAHTRSRAEVWGVKTQTYKQHTWKLKRSSNERRRRGQRSRNRLQISVRSVAFTHAAPLARACVRWNFVEAKKT